jgi:DNA-binding MarR family transcriptional regulator
MNSVFFGLKRAYYGTLRAPRRPLATISMTSAAYDLLTVVEQCAGILQKQVWMCLGVTRSTVCKMLKRLEKLGWVKREKPEQDKRQRIVRITESGVSVLRKSDRLMLEHEDGPCQDTPYVHIPDADGRWYALFTLGFAPNENGVLCSLSESRRMADELGIAFGPYEPWEPD